MSLPLVQNELRPPSGPRQQLAHERSRLRRSVFRWSLAMALLILAAMVGPLVFGRIQTRDDLGAFHLPIRWLYAQRLDAGQSFDWAPELFCGFYATGEGQMGGYHPMHYILFRTLSFPAAAGLSFLLSYPFMLVGTYLFLNRLLQRGDAAMFGALVFTFSSFNLLHFVHPNAIAVTAHLPWLLWAIHVALVESERRLVIAAEVAIALLTGSQILLGYPQYVWLSLVAEGGYAVFLAVTRRYQVRDGCADRGTCGECADCVPVAWLRLLVTKGLGLTLGGVQLLPTLALLQHSTRRGAEAAFADTGSLHPLNLLQWVAPYAMKSRVLDTNTHELSTYLGMVPLVLIVWLLVRPGRLGAWRARFGGLMLFAVLALGLSFGQFTPLYAIQKSLPLIGAFRCPCRHMVLVQLAVAGLAAMGMGMLIRDCLGKAPVPWRRFGGLWLVLLVSVVVAILSLGLHQFGYPAIAAPPRILLGPALCAAAVMLVIGAARNKRWAPVGLVVLAAIDLGCYGLSYAVYDTTATWRQYVDSIQTPPGDPGARVLVDLRDFHESGRRRGNQIVVAGWRRTHGYAGLTPEKQLDYSQLNALRVAGTRWVSRRIGDRIKGLQPGDADWMAVPDPLPRARLVTKAVVSKKPARDLEGVPIDTTAILEHDLALPHAEPGTAEVRVDRPDRIRLLVDCPTPQLLVLNESFAEGWQVWVDGYPRTVWRVNGDFLGCLVGPGRQGVVFRFEPKSRRDGRILSVAGLILLGCVGVVRLVLVPRRLGR